MRICVVGTGYVGLVTGACFADMGNDVIAVDIDREKIAGLKQGQVPFFEPGLEELVGRNLSQGRLLFATRLEQAVRDSKLIFLAVGTPADGAGGSDVSSVFRVAESVAKSMNEHKVIVVKSTVPIGTGEAIREFMSALTTHPFDVVSNPEFLKEGAALEDFMRPDRVVIGAENEEAAEVIRELYKPFTLAGAPILVMDLRSAEMTKYASNAMLATRISFINEVANLCECVGADVNQVRQGIGTDRRIGASFLFPGVGFGGSCFPKDLQALTVLAEQNGCALELIPAVQKVNLRQREVLIEKILRFYRSRLPQSLQSLTVNGRLDWDSLPPFDKEPGTLHETSEGLLKGKRFALWGLSFKPQTDDMREAPSRTVIDRLLPLGAEICAHDPAAMERARHLYGNRIEFAKSHYEALKDADALILVTEWHVYRKPDFSRMRSLMKFPVIFDGRNQFQPREMQEEGFLYFSIGRPGLFKQGG